MSLTELLLEVKNLPSPIKEIILIPFSQLLTFQIQGYPKEHYQISKMESFARIVKWHP